MSKRIYISPSSQPENKYAAGNTNEAEQCGRIAVALEAALIRCGIGCTLPTRDGTTMYERVRESNASDTDIHMPIHSNAFNGNVAGLRIFVGKLGGEAEVLAKAIMDELAPITPGESDRISAEPQLYEIKSTKALCVYLEVGFHDNPTEAQWIIDHTADIAEAICRGCCDYFQADYIAPVDMVVPVDHWYRVRKDWEDASSQLGAFHILDNAKAACVEGYTVYDWTGNAVYYNGGELVAERYTVESFVQDIQKALGVPVDGIAGPVTLGATPTISRSVNPRHAVVKPVQRRLGHIRYLFGEIDGIFGPETEAALIQLQQDHRCVPDGEATAKCKTWQVLLGMR